MLNDNSVNERLKALLTAISSWKKDQRMTGISTSIQFTLPHNNVYFWVQEIDKAASAWLLYFL